MYNMVLVAGYFSELCIGSSVLNITNLWGVYGNILGYGQIRRYCGVVTGWWNNRSDGGGQSLECQGGAEFC